MYFEIGHIISKVWISLFSWSILQKFQKGKKCQHVLCTKYKNTVNILCVQIEEEKDV